MKTFLHMNLSHELIKNIKRNSCLCRFDGQRYLWYDLYHCWLQSCHIPFVNKCDVTNTLLPHGVGEISFNLHNPLNDHFAEDYIILWSHAKINSRLEIPYTIYIVQCNTAPKNNTFANACMCTRLWSPFKITRNSSCAGFTTLTSV